MQYWTFNNEAAAAGAAGRLQRNAADLSWHDGTAARNIVFDTATQTLTGKTLTTPTIGSFTNSTHNHQNAAGGGLVGLTLAGSSTVEGTTATGADADIVSVTLTNTIAVGTPFIILASLRKTTGAAAASSVGLKLNTTVVKPTTAFTSTGNSAQQGMVLYVIGSWDGTNYTFPEFGMAGTDGQAMVFLNTNGTAIPNATITTVVIRGNSGSAAITMGVKNVYIYSLATS